MVEADLRYELSGEIQAANQNWEKSLAKGKLTRRQRQVESSDEDYLRHSSILVDDSIVDEKLFLDWLKAGLDS